jgi:hypothetical protein
MPARKWDLKTTEHLPGSDTLAEDPPSHQSNQPIRLAIRPSDRAESAPKNKQPIPRSFQPQVQL